MAESAASTAMGPMVIVALEQFYPQAQRVIDDPLAQRLLPRPFQLVIKACALPPLRRGLINFTENSVPGIVNAILCRKRFVQDKLIAALNAPHGKQPVNTLVILGAGFDTLAYRLPQLATCQVYEVDLPENIKAKRKQLVSLFGRVPAHVTLVPIDFGTQALDDVLAAHGYTFAQPTFFVWEGVTQYLTEAAVRDVLRVLSQAQSGSRLIFTYVQEDFMTGRNTFGLDNAYKRFRIKSQLWHFGLQPNEVADFIGAYGWNVADQLDANGCTTRYLMPAARTGAVLAIERSVYAEKGVRA